MNMYLKNIVSSLANNYSNKQLWDKIFDAMDTGNVRREMILREAVDKKEVIKGYYYRDLPNSIKTMALVGYTGPIYPFKN